MCVRVFIGVCININDARLYTHTHTHTVTPLRWIAIQGIVYLMKRDLQKSPTFLQKSPIFLQKCPIFLQKSPICLTKSLIFH